MLSVFALDLVEEVWRYCFQIFAIVLMLVVVLTSAFVLICRMKGFSGFASTSGDSIFHEQDLSDGIDRTK